MRWFFLALIPLVLNACMETASAPTSRSNPCIAAFKAYDRALSVNLGSIFRDQSSGSPTIKDRELLLASEAAIRQNDCIFNSAEVPQIITPRPGIKLNRAGDSGQLGRTRYMHVAITTDRNGARNLEQYFAGLGYSVRVVAADRLGWRVFLGPLMSNGAVYHAERLMGQVGLNTAYVVNSG